MIDLAARKWDVKTRVAIRRLQEHGFSLPVEETTVEKIEEHVQWGPRYRRRLNAFCADASEYLLKTNSAALRRLALRCRIQNRMTPENWRQGPGQLFGAFHRDGIERALRQLPDTQKKIEHHVFRNNKWTDALVLPYYSLPGRICGFLFIGRDGCPTRDHVYYPIHTTKRAATEGGVFGYWSPAKATGLYSNSVVACGDPALVMRLQVRNFASSQRPMPLVAYYDGLRIVTRTAWQAFQDKRLVFWGWQLTPSLLYQAIICDGAITLTPFRNGHATQERIDHLIRDNEPRELLKRVVRRARPWPEELRIWAKYATDSAVEDLVIGLEPYGISVHALAKIHKRFRKLARSKRRPVEQVPVTLLGSYCLYEKNGEYWGYRTREGHATSDAELIMNGILEIHRIENDADNSSYVGVVKAQDKTAPVRFPVGGDTAAVAKLLLQQVAREADGYVLYISPGWLPTIIQAATRQCAIQNRAKTA
jgi:hypothetical protein